MVVVLPSCRPKDVIPKRRADAVSGLIIPVMMAKMILLQPEPHSVLHWKMMRRVVKHVVANVAEDQPGKDARRHATKDQKKKAVKKEREWDADTRRHDQSSRIVWIIVVNTVNDVVQPFSGSRLGFVMKDVPVDDVFEQCPEQNTQQKKSCDNQE